MTGETTLRARPRASSVFLFLVLAGIAIAALQAAHGFFPGDRGGARAGRWLCFAAAIALLVLGSQRLLRRDGLPTDRLALGFTAAHGRAFLIGAGVAVVHLLALLGVMYAVAPFEITLSASPPVPPGAVPGAAVGYLAGNCIEELVFRGYLLIVLAQWIGTHRALWLLALPFGLFHFPGLDGAAVAKMMLTTGAGHFAFAFVFLATRSLWAAVAMHAAGNTLLHVVLGIGEPTLLSLRFLHDPPVATDLPFLAFLGVSILLAVILGALPATRAGVAWLERREIPGGTLVPSHP
jgi:membrane protease YdiL (CAAX protease family)